MMTARSRHKSDRGFSLIEMLLVAFILGIGLLGLAALQTMGIRGYAGSREKDAAAYLAGSVLDTLAAEGRMLQACRENGSTSPVNRFSGVAEDTLQDYQVAGTGTIVYPEFDLEGKPVLANAGVFVVQWAIRSRTASGTPAAATTLLDGHEVVVNVGWELTRGADNPAQKWLTFSRYIRH